MIVAVAGSALVGEREGILSRRGETGRDGLRRREEGGGGYDEGGGLSMRDEKREDSSDALCGADVCAA